jgi:starch synthase
MLEKAYQSLARSYPGTVSYTGRLDEELAHKIYAGADMFLMPSRFEPCGLSQLIAMRYGTLPIVSKVGGLVDTVVGFDGKNENTATGFFIDLFTPAGIYNAVVKALTMYTRNRVLWNRLMRSAMRTDVSWDKSAQVYLELYRKTIA